MANVAMLHALYTNTQMNWRYKGVRIGKSYKKHPCVIDRIGKIKHTKMKLILGQSKGTHSPAKVVPSFHLLSLLVLAPNSTARNRERYRAALDSRQ